VFGIVRIANVVAVYIGGSRIFAHLGEIVLVDIAERREILVVARNSVPLWIAKGS
jgi:hypothetical protein